MRKNFIPRNPNLDDYRSPVKTYELIVDGASVVDQEIPLSGMKLKILVHNAHTLNFYIRINDLSAPRIRIHHNETIICSFTRLYFTGSVWGKVLFYAVDDPDYEISYPANNEWGGLNVTSVAAGNTLNIQDRVLGIYVESLGNLVVNFGGANITFSNVPAGTFLPISPSTIVNTTTCNIQVIYCDPVYSL